VKNDDYSSSGRLCIFCTIAVFLHGCFQEKESLMRVTSICFAIILITMTSLWGQVDIRWDVPLGIPAEGDSARHMTVLSNGNVAVWGGGNLNVMDTLGAEIWHWEISGPGIQSASILDVQPRNGGLLAAFCFGSEDTIWTCGLSRFSEAGDSMEAHTWMMGDYCTQLAAIGEVYTYFAGLDPCASLAPHGMVSLVSNAGDSLWTWEELPYAMDNMNRFVSEHALSDNRVLFAVTYGLPGMGTNSVLTVYADAFATGIPHGSPDTLTLVDALVVANGQRWVIGVQQADVARRLWIEGEIGVTLPLAQEWEFFDEDAIAIPPDGGILLSGHVGGSQAASRTFLMRVSQQLDAAWTATLPDYDRFTYVFAHPDGGYLALALEGSPASYHLIRFVESTEDADSHLSPYPLAFPYIPIPSIPPPRSHSLCQKQAMQV
jgi:hypothetical protein